MGPTTVNVILLLSLSFSNTVASRFFDFSLTPRFRVYDGYKLHLTLEALSKQCDHGVIPWANHPMSLVDLQLFQKAYLSWLNRVYHEDLAITVEQDLFWPFTHFKGYSERRCRDFSGYDSFADPTNAIKLPISKLLQYYSLMELKICRTVAGLVSIPHDISNQSIVFTDTAFNITFEPHPRLWNIRYLSAYQSASSFATVFTFFGLLTILLIRHPRLFAFAFRG
ncbi:ORF2a' protein [Pebjah virus]|uniref:ORF2a' protein n=1 Tax=Pebjah virus TaxID=1658615 RepID=A0A0G2UML2_9NIDO|nr:ORF2a' protein [Pebjah virus]AKI29927.1 ORF2a' protein [Pebjah virus]AKI29942.1 ORF2a' protein [Pebjah virus]AKI29957.1 ORF2a' protein [Pebjah virus]